MKIAENENNMTNPVNNPLPTTVELFTLCTQYVYAYTFLAGTGFKKEVYLLSHHIFKQSTKLDTIFVSYF